MARKAIFVDPDEDRPLYIYFDHSLKRDIREEWTETVEKYGGKVVRDDADADIVVCSKTCDIFLLRAQYGAHKNKSMRGVTVKSLDFLETCIHEKKLVEIADRVKGMSGRKQTQDTPRVPFTEADDNELAWYLAGTVPEPSAGGRRGNNIYKQLVRMADKPGYAWVKRHTWESWRNRYNKNHLHFDKKIASLVPTVNPKKNHNWNADRRVNIKRFEEQEEGSEEGSDQENRDEEDEAQDPDKTEDTEEDPDDSQPGPSNKGKGRAPPEDDEEEDRRSERDENEGEAENATPPPLARQGEGQNDFWENVEHDDFQPPMDPDEPPENSAPPPGSAERHARFAADVRSRSSTVENGGSPSRRRRLSEESSSNKRPRLSADSATSSGSQSGVRKGARLPPGKVPGARADSDPEDDDDDDDEPDSEALGAAHSLFSEGELELDEDENEQEDELEPEPAPAPVATAQVISGTSAASSTTAYPISGDRTLVASASPRKQPGMSPRKMARLSSASRKEVYLPLDQVQAGGVVAMDVIVVSDDEEMLEDAVKDQPNPKKPEETVKRWRSPSVEIVSSQRKARSPESIDPPEPTAQASRNRRRRAERQLQRPSAPTRMTRSRSQSVEPTEFVSLPLGSSKRKGKGKAKMVEPEPEIIEEVDEEQLENREEYVPGKETLEEEDDVMNIVTNEEDFSAVSNATSGQQESVVSSSSSNTISRAPSPSQPSSDDEQTIRRIAAQHQKLRDTLVKKGPRKTDALIQAFNAKAEQGKNKPMIRPSLPLNALMMNPPMGARSVSAHQRGSEKKRTPRPYKAPHTPTPHPVNVKQPSGMRDASVAASSSEETTESIPMRGTRAKAFKTKVEEEEKYTPYTPPAGTRASQYSQYSQERHTGRSSQRR